MNKLNINQLPPPLPNIHIFNQFAKIHKKNDILEKN